MIGSKCDGLASQRGYFTWNDRFCDISPRWQFQPVPFTGTPILRRPYLLMFFPVRYAAWRQLLMGLFAQIPTMAACCRFSPFFRRAPFAQVKKGVGNRRPYLLEHSPWISATKHCLFHFQMFVWIKPTHKCTVMSWWKKTDSDIDITIEPCIFHRFSRWFSNSYAHGCSPDGCKAAASSTNPSFWANLADPSYLSYH